MISSMELTDEQKLKFDQALRGFYSIKDATTEIAAEFKLEDKLNLVHVKLLESPCDIFPTRPLFWYTTYILISGYRSVDEVS